MKIHLITNLFHPDELAGAALYTDFARYFHGQGHEVRVTAAFSYYPAWKRRDEDIGLTTRDDVFDGIPVRRISMYIPRRPRGITRLLSDASFLMSIIRHGTFHGWRPDVVITACPMLSQCVAQRFLYRCTGVKRLIIVQDFVVDAALELGILRFHLPTLGATLRAFERWALLSADELSTISPEMLAKLDGITQGKKPARYIPNWIHEDLARQIADQSVTPVEREARSLFYSGNLGIKQGLPDFIESFLTLKNDWSLRIQGGGPEADRIKERAACSKIELGPVQDIAGYVSRLRQCTACLVTQRAGVSANFLPSKLLPALVTGTPVLAVADETSPLAREISATGCGIVAPPDDASALDRALHKLSNPSVIADMSSRAKERANFFSRERVLGEFNDLLLSMLKN